MDNGHRMISWFCYQRNTVLRAMNLTILRETELSGSTQMVPEHSVLYCNSSISSLYNFISTRNVEILIKLETDMGRTYAILRLNSGILRCRPMQMFHTLRLWQNRHHFANDIWKNILLNENVWLPIKISMTINLKGPINNIPALVQIMIWGRQGDKPLSKLMIIILLMHICVTRPQWVRVISMCLSRCRLTSIIEGTARLVDIHLRYTRFFFEKIAWNMSCDFILYLRWMRLAHVP